MIILTLKEDEKIFIGDNVSVLVVEISGKQVKLGITAPPKVKILRGALDKLKGPPPELFRKKFIRSGK